MGTGPIRWSIRAKLRAKSGGDILDVYNAEREGHIEGYEGAGSRPSVHDLRAEITHSRNFSTWPIKVGATHQMGYKHGHVRAGPMVQWENLRETIRLIA